MRVRDIIILVVLSTLVFAVLYGCGGSAGSSDNTSTVTVYTTDDLGGYDSVELTLHTVRLDHTGSARRCEIIHGPLTLDAAELGHDQLLELVDTTNCEAGPYNRLHVEVGENVTLVDNSHTVYACRFVSYLDGQNQPNSLACANGLCSLDITGAVNLVAGQHEHVALDVDLKNFTVDFTRTPCEVTLKVSPLNASGIDTKMTAGYRKSISGVVSNLNTAADSFVLTQGAHTYNVNYAGVSDQSGVDTLLTRATADQLRTKVRCEQFNQAATPPTCTAQTSGTHPLKAVTVSASGTVSALDTGVHSFTLNYPVSKTLPVNYHTAFLQNDVEGTLANGSTADTALYGFDVDFFLTRGVEAGQ